MFEYWQSPNLLMFYKMRGWGPEYTVDTVLEHSGGPGFLGYGKRKVNLNSIPRTRVRRLVRPRYIGVKHRYEAKKCKVGDIVYSSFIFDSKLKIQPWIITAIDDSFYEYSIKNIKIY